MSRSTRRIEPPDDVWPTVDAWAATVAGRRGAEAWARSRCRLEARSGPYLDVLGPPEEAAAALTARGVDVRPVRRAVAARGTMALPADAAVVEALAAAEVEVRVVTEARRYAWRGPALAPVLLEIATTPDQAVVEAWWEDVFSAWPKLGREGPGRPAPRRRTATAQINRLLADLGQPPIVAPA